MTLPESLRLRNLCLRVCEEGRGGLPGLRWAWNERTQALHGAGVQQVSSDRSRYFIGRGKGVSESLPSVCGALVSASSSQHHRLKTVRACLRAWGVFRAAMAVRSRRLTQSGEAAAGLRPLQRRDVAPFRTLRRSSHGQRSHVAVQPKLFSELWKAG